MLGRNLRKYSARWSKKKGAEIYPEEIFLDARNLPDYDTHQFEGRFEKPISEWRVRIVALLFLVSIVVFVRHAWALQVTQGSIYREQSEDNRLRHVEYFAERGVIYDRNGVELAWNEFGEDQEFARRRYITKIGLAHLLGFVDYPSRDVHGFFYRTAIEGRDGAERAFDQELSGQNGVRIIEIDAFGDVQSASVLEAPRDGKNVTLSIDTEVQTALNGFIADTVRTAGFQGGAGVIMDVNSGELLAVTSFPEYNHEKLTENISGDTLDAKEEDFEAPFLNRAVSGRYIPGSIIKPFLAIGALAEGLVQPDTTFVSTGQLVVPNPYDPDSPSVFKDWRAHGRVDLRRALAVSSNVYFYNIGGGYSAQEGLGIERIEKYLRMFGFGQIGGVELAGEAKGVIPNKQWKAENYEDGVWRLGDTYNTAIGQYGMQVTPLQAARAIGAVANGGVLQAPHVGKDQIAYSGKSKYKGSINIDIAPEHFEEVRAGMRQAVEVGTAKGLYMHNLKIAAKTGTAQVNSKSDHAWIVGFFPYDNPMYSFAVVLERGPAGNLIGGVSVMRQMFEWLIANKPEYL